MSMRERWTFDFTAKNLAAAASKKKAHHAERVKFWEQAKDKVMIEVRETGIEVSESLAASYTTNATHGPQVMVRTDLQKKLSECHGKIQEHTSRVRDYTGWEQVLGGNAEARLQLNADDYLFFFGE